MSLNKKQAKTLEKEAKNLAKEQDKEALNIGKPVESITKKLELLSQKLDTQQTKNQELVRDFLDVNEVKKLNKDSDMDYENRLVT